MRSTAAQSSQCTLLLAGLALWAVLAHRKRPYSELMGSLPGSLPGTDVSSKRGPASNAPSSPALTSGDPSSPRQSWEETRRAQSETGSAPHRYTLGETFCNASLATSPGFGLSRKKEKRKTTPFGASLITSLVLCQAAQLCLSICKALPACSFACSSMYYFDHMSPEAVSHHTLVDFNPGSCTMCLLMQAAWCVQWTV